ncbi:MAG: hypothetical protein JWQ27_440 [Ferruginibacter sp.]|nr:hypothetical protein [Ferruginibacter sp.]
MKKILLTLAVAFTIFGAEAQQSKSKKSKKSPVNKEARAQAAFAKAQAEKQAQWEEQRLERLAYDSARLENERLAAEKFEQDRVVLRDTKTHVMDSINFEKYKSFSTQQAGFYTSDKYHNDIIAAAKLTTAQGREVKIINEAYTNKAKMLTADATLTDAQRKEQLVVLNTERKAKIKAIVGNGKAKKLEKERKEFVKKNGVDPNDSWINEVDGYAKNN